MGDLVKITGLWLNRTKDGKEYLSGNFGSARVLIFENRDRVSDKIPTHTLFITSSDPKPQPQDQGPRQERPANRPPADEEPPF